MQRFVPAGAADTCSEQAGYCWASSAGGRARSAHSPPAELHADLANRTLQARSLASFADTEHLEYSRPAEAFPADSDKRPADKAAGQIDLRFALEGSCFHLVETFL